MRSKPPRAFVGTGGVVNMSATDHMGLDLSAFPHAGNQERRLDAGELNTA
jgi:hypothetical protein